MQNRVGNLKNMPRYGDRSVVPVSYHIPTTATTEMDTQEIMKRAPVEDDMIPYAKFSTNESHQKQLMSVNPFNVTVDTRMNTEDFEPTSRAARLNTQLEIDGGGVQEEFQNRKYVTKKSRGNNKKFMNVQQELPEVLVKQPQEPPRAILRDRGTQEFSAGYQTDTIVNNNPKFELSQNPTIDMINPNIMQDFVQITHKSHVDRENLRRIVLQNRKQFGHQMNETEVNNILKVEAIQKQRKLDAVRLKIDQDAYEVQLQQKRAELSQQQRGPIATYQAPDQEHIHINTKHNKDIQFKRTPSLQPNNHIRHDEVNTTGRIKPVQKSKKELSFISVNAENKARINQDAHNVNNVRRKTNLKDNNKVKSGKVTVDTDTPHVQHKQTKAKLQSNPKLNTKTVINNNEYEVETGIKWEKIGVKKQTEAKQVVDVDHIQVENTDKQNIKLDGKSSIVKNFHTIGQDVHNKLYTSKPKTKARLTKDDRGKNFEDHVSFITVEDKKKGVKTSRKDTQPSTRLIEAVHEIEPGRERIEEQPVKLNARQEVFDADDDLDVEEQEVPLKISNMAQSHHVPIEEEDSEDEPVTMGHPKQIFF